MLHSKFIYSLSKEFLRTKLLTKLAFKKAVLIAVISLTSGTVHDTLHLSSWSTVTNTKAYRCGGNHYMCSHPVEYYACGKTGYMARVFFSKSTNHSYMKSKKSR